MTLALRRLPGIRVDAAPPPLAQALPRMDVAVLVGFASTGPLHLPVAVESVAQFTAVFGPDAPLAWDGVQGERVYACLGPAVRAFFSNGGQRCWVIRVARVDGDASPTVPVAKANGFAIPGVLSLDADGAVRPAMAQARCEGSWSDVLRVATALRKRSFAIEALVATASPPPDRLSFLTRIPPALGDVVQFDDAAGRCAFATVEEVGVVADPGGAHAVEATLRAAFERIDAGVVSPPPEWSGAAVVAGFGAEVAATLFPPLEDGEGATLRFDAPMPASLEAGHWARWNASGETIWLRIDRIETQPAFAGSPAAMDSSHVLATVHGPAWRELGAAWPFATPSMEVAHALSLDVHVDDASGDVASLAGVGLTVAHDAGWWSNVSDADFYEPRNDAVPGSLAGTPETRRFPLARAPQPDPAAWLPLGVEPLFTAALAPLPDVLTPLERDGLSRFDASLFLDPELAQASMDAIAQVADTIRYIREPARALRGLHAAWSIGVGGLFNEASLIAIPDAIHLGWHKYDAPPPPLPQPPASDTPPSWHTHRGPCAGSAGEPLQGPDFGNWLDCATHAVDAPFLRGPAAPVPPGAYRLEWSAVDPSASYVLKEATLPHFEDARVVFTGADTQYIALNPRDGTYYYQVFAQVGTERSAGSNAVTVVVRADEWIQDPPRDDGAMESQWLAIHRAALRMAAAGGELFAALAMPRHFRTRDALRYTARLRAVRVPPGGAEPGALGFTEAPALSHGALYFPWLQSQLRSAPGGPGLTNDVPRLRASRTVPPDGALLGVLAARASSRGAWIAAANEPLKDIVALTPTVPAADWQALQDAQVNLVRDDPRGFLALSADTLALDDDRRPINVRRLLILLRRLALRRGVSYVFEPNGDVLRRAVERGFDALLGDLFRRGAFAGRTPADAYRVVADDTINSSADADAGRFIVELRVAPSIPMRFIAVLLAQSGERLAVTEEP